MKESTSNPPEEPYASDDSQPITLENLNFILEQHQLWLVTEAKEGRRANFRGMNLKHLDLSRQPLVEASFRGADLSGVSLAEADLHGADLAEANLQRASLKGAKLSNANLTRANLAYADMQEADMPSANFHNAILEGAKCEGARFTSANFREADMRGAVLKDAVLAHANLRAANLSSAILERTDLDHADCRETRFDRAMFDNTRLHHTMLRGATFEQVDMSKADFSQSLEVSPEYQALSFQNERIKLLDEQRQIHTQREEITQTQTDLQKQLAVVEREKALLLDLSSARESFIEGYERHASWFGYIALVWFLCAAVMVLITYSQLTPADIRELNWLEIFIVFGILAGIMGMFLFTAAHAWQISRLIRKYGNIHAEKKAALEGVAQSPEAKPTPPKKSKISKKTKSIEKESATIIPLKKKRENGFGKRKAG